MRNKAVNADSQSELQRKRVWLQTHRKHVESCYDGDGADGTR